MSIKSDLKSLKIDNNALINGVRVDRTESVFIIDGQEFDINEAARYIEQNGSDEKFFAVKLCSGEGNGLCYKVSQKQYKSVLEYANKNHCVVYRGPINNNGKQYGPWAIDWDTIGNVVKSEDDLVCEHCGKKCSSRSGLSLHLKQCVASDDSLRCSECGKVCKTELGLRLHQRNTHGSNVERNKEKTGRSS